MRALRLRAFGGAALLAATLVAGCAQQVVVPQLVRSYVMDWPQAVGPDGKALASSVTVLVANETYLQDQCANQVRAGGPQHPAPHLAQFGCVRISLGNRAEIVVPDRNEQAAVAHQLDHLKGRWCHDAQQNPIECPR